MLSEVLKFNQYQKSDEAPFIIYADLACLVEKIDGCKNNPEKSSKKKVGEHIPSDFSKNKHNIYRGKNCMKTFWEYLREHVIKIINSKKKKVMLSTNEQQKLYENLKINLLKIKSKVNIIKLETNVIIQGNMEVLKIAFLI